MHFAAAMRGADEDERVIPVMGRLPNDDARETERDECWLSAVRVGGDGTCSAGLSHARQAGIPNEGEADSVDGNTSEPTELKPPRR